jgi:hypothetical protein
MAWPLLVILPRRPLKLPGHPGVHRDQKHLTMAKGPARNKLSRSPGASAKAGASWLALVAATSLGMGHLGFVRAEITAEPGVGTDAADGAYRLIVQSYAAASVGADQRPEAFARPLGSTQRAITAEELEKGVAVDIVQVGDSALDGSVVVAWIERGAPDLEFDARQARPAPDSSYGVAAPAGSDGAHVVLKRRNA